jgi:hypothetical protein
MKQNLLIVMGAMFILATAGGAFSEGMSHDMAQMATDNGMKGMDHSGHGGENIHNAVVDGYRFAYQLIDIREKMADMKAAGHAHEGMDATHHLMVYIENPDGTTVDDAQVGFLVEGPDGTKQKIMCMGMGGGFGADVSLGGSGDYLIKTKVVAGEIKLIDAFPYPEK